MSDSKNVYSNSVDLEASAPSRISSTSQVASCYDQPEMSAEKGERTRTSHRIDSKIVYDAILGLSDGLTVPFALTAGLASLGTTRVVILGGLAELIAGAISMGLGGFIGAQSESESYHTSGRECDRLLRNQHHKVTDIIDSHFQQYNLCSSDRKKITDRLLQSESDTRSFLMRHHFGVEKPAGSRPYMSAITLGMSYFLGGFIALVPYFCVPTQKVNVALWWSIGIMAVVMFVFGYVKTCVICGWRGRDNVVAGFKGAVQMLVIGALAVGAAVGLVKAIDHAGGNALR